jgi:hypothetical protein
MRAAAVDFSFIGALHEAVQPSMSCAPSARRPAILPSWAKGETLRALPFWDEGGLMRADAVSAFWRAVTTELTGFKLDLWHWRDTNMYSRSSYTLRAGHSAGQHRMEILRRARRPTDTLDRRCRPYVALLRFPCEG